MRVSIIGPPGLGSLQGEEWVAFLDAIRASGHGVFVGDSLDAKPEALVSINHQAMAVRLMKRNRLRPEQCALVVLEPVVTSPAMYRRRARGHYGHVFAASPFWASHFTAGESFPWPQNVNRDVRPLRSDFYAATLVNADKRSAVAGSLYGLRREVVARADRAGVPIAVIGHGWEGSRIVDVNLAARALAKATLASQVPRFWEAAGGIGAAPRHWQGSIAEKADALSLAPVSIVIENSADYVSEKLIDVVRCGRVPIYVGPDLRSFGFPKDIAVQSEPNAVAILDVLQSLEHEQMNSLLDVGNQWLAAHVGLCRSSERVMGELGVRIGSLWK